MNKLNFMGIGPKIALIAFPWLAAAIYFSVKIKNIFTFTEDGNKILFYTGLALVIAGAIFYFFTVPALLKGLKETKLITTGTFGLCCNPLYAAVILLIIPGVAFMMNSWLVFSSSIAAYVFFKVFIKSEYAEMEKFFGEDFRKYRAETPEFFPFPFKKWFKSA